MGGLGYVWIVVVRARVGEIVALMMALSQQQDTSNGCDAYLLLYTREGRTGTMGERMKAVGKELGISYPLVLLRLRC